MNIDIKRKQVDLGRLIQSLSEQELKVLERMEDIARIEENIKIQQEAIKAKEAEIKELKDGGNK